jgi:hypothetical protein
LRRDVSRIGNGAIERQRRNQLAEVENRDRAMGQEILRRLEAGEIPPKLIGAARYAATALSKSPSGAAVSAADYAILYFKSLNRNPSEIGASWRALKRARNYEFNSATSR